jgi:hypothetical protein
MAQISLTAWATVATAVLPSTMIMFAFFAAMACSLR